MTKEQKALLELVTDELGGKLSYETCITKNTQHKRIVIEYDFNRKGKDLS